MKSKYILILGIAFVLVSAYFSIGLPETPHLNSMIWTLGIGNLLMGVAIGKRGCE